MNEQSKRHVIAEPYPETIGVSALTIWVPDDFRGAAEIIWWYPGKSADTDRQRMTCSCAWLLQGVYHDVRGSRPREDLLGPRATASFDARIVALVLHTFYRLRIEAAARLEAAYEWRPYLPEDQMSPKPSRDSETGIAEAKRGLGAVMNVAWKALSPEDFESATTAARTLRQLLVKMESKGDQA